MDKKLARPRPPFEARLVRYMDSSRCSLGRDKVVGGIGLAVIVREGSEAEAKRAVVSLPLLQFAINNAFCSCV